VVFTMVDPLAADDEPAAAAGADALLAGVLAVPLPAVPDDELAHAATVIAIAAIPTSPKCLTSMQLSPLELRISSPTIDHVGDARAVQRQTETACRMPGPADLR
jgi:hypothetical protein